MDCRTVKPIQLWVSLFFIPLPFCIFLPRHFGFCRHLSGHQSTWTKTRFSRNVIYLLLATRWQTCPSSGCAAAEQAVTHCSAKVPSNTAHTTTAFKWRSCSVQTMRTNIQAWERGEWEAHREDVEGSQFKWCWLIFWSFFSLSVLSFAFPES